MSAWPITLPTLFRSPPLLSLRLLHCIRRSMAGGRRGRRRGRAGWDQGGVRCVDQRRCASGGGGRRSRCGKEIVRVGGGRAQPHRRGWGSRRPSALLLAGRSQSRRCSRADLGRVGTGRGLAELSRAPADEEAAALSVVAVSGVSE
jgi:hypothetical protein